jgi:acyl-CoA thioesterase
VSELVDDTTLSPAEGAWAGSISSRWNVGANPNGGYLLALATRAALAETARPDPLSVTAHYVTPPTPGPVTVLAETVRAGRRYATVAARVVQGGAERLRLLAATGDLDAQHGPSRVAGSPPSLPPPERCVDNTAAALATGVALPEVARRYELRLDPDSAWVAARSGTRQLPVDQPLRVDGWIRFADGSDPSVLGLLAFADAFPPTPLATVAAGWVPTVELTVQVRGRPAPGWVLGSFRTRFLVDGLFEVDGELWGGDGRLLALSRQLALVLTPRPGGVAPTGSSDVTLG